MSDRLDVPDLRDVETFHLGDRTCTMHRVVVDDSKGRSFIEYECDDPDCVVGCRTRTSHRLHHHAVGQFSQNGFLTIEEADQ